MDIRIVSVRNQGDARGMMKEIGVEPAGRQIMAPKSRLHLVKINKLPIIAANILKQETLSLGADTAVSRDVLTGKIKHSDCLIIANVAQLSRLCEKLKIQPYGLGKIALDLKRALENYEKQNFILRAGRFELNLNSRIHIMGILNLTPDSFSGDGLYGSPGQGYDLTKIRDLAEKMANDGADIIDIGGESSRPGASPVSVKEELKRVLPVVKELSKRIKVPISIDTYKPEVAHQALDNGAAMVNDIRALGSDLKMAKVIKKYQAAVVLMHMHGKPQNMQKKPQYQDLMGEIIGYLSRSMRTALDSGISLENIIIDPGVGFGKTLRHNLEILKSLAELKVLGRPILVGVSRKSFIGQILNSPPQDRLMGTISSLCLAAVNGASIARVHDVREVRQALAVLDEIRAA